MDAAVDKKGEALRQQRFKMLEDIAAEIAGDVVFPSCFDVVLRLRAELRDPDLSIERIAALVQTEPLICAQLIRQANSVAQGVSNEVRDVHGAIMRLGLETVRHVALAIAMTQLVRSKQLVPFSEFSKLLWQHSQYAASAAHVIAAELTRFKPDEAQFAGLVHDLGAFYMLYRAAQYEELRIRPDSVRHLIVQWHESIGESLLFALKLPEFILDAVRAHERPKSLLEDPANLAEVVCAADRLASVRFNWMGDAAAGESVELGEQYHALVDKIEARFVTLQAEFLG